MPRDPDARYEQAAQVLPFFLHESLKTAVHTSFFGTVISYDSATKRARIQPAPNLIVREGGRDRSMPRSPILDVPVRQTAVGGYLVHQQIDEGDALLCVVSERSLDAWKARWGESYDPEPEILFDAQDAVAIPWGDPDVAPTSDQGIVLQKADGTVQVQVATDRVLLEAGGVTLRVDASGVTITGGMVTHDGVNIGATHRHGGVQSGGAVTNVPQ